MAGSNEMAFTDREPRSGLSDRNSDESDSDLSEVGSDELNELEIEYRRNNNLVDTNLQQANVEVNNSEINNSEVNNAEIDNLNVNSPEVNNDNAQINNSEINNARIESYNAIFNNLNINNTDDDETELDNMGKSGKNNATLAKNTMEGNQSVDQGAGPSVDESTQTIIDVKDNNTQTGAAPPPRQPYTQTLLFPGHTISEAPHNLPKGATADMSAHRARMLAAQTLFDEDPMQLSDIQSTFHRLNMERHRGEYEVRKRRQALKSIEKHEDRYLKRQDEIKVLIARWFQSKKDNDGIIKPEDLAAIRAKIQAHVDFDKQEEKLLGPAPNFKEVVKEHDAKFEDWTVPVLRFYHERAIRAPRIFSWQTGEHYRIIEAILVRQAENECLWADLKKLNRHMDRVLKLRGYPNGTTARFSDAQWAAHYLPQFEAEDRLKAQGLDQLQVERIEKARIAREDWLDREWYRKHGETAPPRVPINEAERAEALATVERFTPYADGFEDFDPVPPKDF